MSLINDALKKAQTLQTRGPATPPAFPRPNPPATTGNLAGPAAIVDPLAGTSAAAPAQPPRKEKSSHTAIVLAIAGCVLLVGLGAVGYVVYALFFMGTPEEQLASPVRAPAAVTAPVAPVSPPPATSPAAESIAAAPAPGPSPAPADEPPATPAPAPAVAAATVAPPPPAAAEPAPAIAAPPAPAPAPAAPPIVAEEEEEHENNPKPHISAWVDKITVAGIRAGDRPKALMNDRVFLIGDVVNHELGLTLTKISDRQLVFEDPEGNTYTYTF